MRRRYRDLYGYGYPPARGYGYRYGPRYGYGGSSCLRDACLLETGCCIGEALDNSCLLASVLLLPQIMGAFVTGLRSGGSGGGLVSAIRVYQRRISAQRRRPVCRFTPSCSEYTAQALLTHGTLRGLRLGAGRLLRCRPGGARGADPVPAVQQAAATAAA
jgi:putative membrane protein insertion efficiency factor